MAEIRRMFRVKRGEVNWPPRSPNISPCDFVCGDILKALFISNKLRTVGEQKNIIEREVRAKMANFAQKLKKCVTKEWWTLNCGCL